MTSTVVSPELVLVTPELRASACAALPPYPPYPPRPVTLPRTQHRARATQVAVYTLAAVLRTAVWGAGVAGTLAAIAIAAHLI